MSEESRLSDLEIRIAHLERGLQELSDVIIRQQKDLERASERYGILAERIAALHEDGAADALGERPPHY